MGRKVDVLRKFGKRVSERRKQKGLTYWQLAQITGLEASQIKKIEAGQSNLYLTTIVFLARGLEISPDQLLEDI